ncbi:unnamed protein product [Linum trigynum]|uniref:Uncharacterized protein n=1 Tax=Linum trigynum TaxID=586398 RepID=A0AAV2DQ52_9ROSI
MDAAKLLDLGFSGPRFTWFRGTTDCTHKAGRIDRSLCNSNWNLAFPDSSVHHLPRLHSDHLPILTSSSTLSNPHSTNKPFRFEAAWVLHNQFVDFFVDSWKNDLELHQALKDISPKLQHWNKAVFGIIYQRKKRLLARILGVQTRLASAFNQGLVKLQAKLEAELDLLPAQEQVIWYQRAKEKWVKLGEQNTSYFHQQATRRRRRNRILALRDDNGDWISEPVKLLDLVVNFYKILYKHEDVPYEDLMPKHSFPRLKLILQ